MNLRQVAVLEQQPKAHYEIKILALCIILKQFYY